MLEVILAYIAVVLTARGYIEYRSYRFRLAQKPPELKAEVIQRITPVGEKTAVDDWIVKSWAIEEWEKELKKHPPGSPKRKAYEDRLKSVGKYGDRHTT